MNSLPFAPASTFGDRPRLTRTDQTPRPAAQGSGAEAGRPSVWAGWLGLWTLMQRHTGLNQHATTSPSDELTGLPSRRTLHEQLRTMMSARTETATAGRGRGQGQPMWSVLLIDIDYFQAVNNRYGVQAGDEVLRAMGTTLRAELRQVDVLGRWGGEEFMALLPDTPFEGAMVAGERLRRAVSLRTFPYAGSVTVSIGVASSLSGDTTERVMARADAGMYAAKRAGRNRVAFTE